MSVRPQIETVLLKERETNDYEDSAMDVFIASHYEKRNMNMCAFFGFLFLSCGYIAMMQYSLVCCNSNLHQRMSQNQWTVDRGQALEKYYNLSLNNASVTVLSNASLFDELMAIDFTKIHD